MTVDTTAQQTQVQTQTQMRKMDGSGGGQGGGGGMQGAMKSTMQALPEDTQTVIKDQLQQLDPAAKKEMTNQIASLDSQNMSVDELTSSIMDMFNPQSQEKNNAATATAIGATFVAYV
ncbi:MAG: hypothetical protein U9Q33_12675 [Campylobacterota bacterium]|nr:hypothetical protein [Campylobacterota bacterium]